MSLRQYEYALAIAEEGSVTAAAERLRVAQPSISQQIRALERELGVTLFGRTPQGLVPTVTGRAFLKEAEIAVSASRRARAAARAESGDLAGELVVASQMGLGSRQLPVALGALRRRYPALAVTLFEESDPADVERMARQGRLDLALVNAAPQRCGFEEHRLGVEPYVAIFGGGHPLLAAATLTLADLAGEPWIRFTRGSVLEDLVSGALREAGVAVTTVARASQIVTAVRLAAEGVGITIVPAAAIPPGCEDHARALEPPLSQPVIAAVRQHAGPAETALLDLLRWQHWHDA
jgi:DNA-binding transcriptional LysR family regulator